MGLDPKPEPLGSRVARAVWGTFGVAMALGSAMFVAIAASELRTGEGNTERSTLVGLVVRLPAERCGA